MIMSDRLYVTEGRRISDLFIVLFPGWKHYIQRHLKKKEKE